MLVFVLIVVGLLLLAVGVVPLFLNLRDSAKRQQEKRGSFARLLACLLLGIGLSFWVVWILGEVRP